MSKGDAALETRVHEPASWQEFPATEVRAQALAEQLWDVDLSADDRDLLAAEIDHEDDSRDVVVGRRFAIYRCDAVLGKGGMGRVYLAYHTHLRRPCALKLAMPLRHLPAAAIERMILTEARSAASLIHPNIVTVHAIGEDQGRHFIEMELVTGGSLRQLLLREGPLPIVQGLQWMTAVCAGIEYSHRQGILHRDIKPENILICSRGVPKLTDFGLAQAYEAARPLASSYACGTLPYMAPEILESGQYSPASDVYALGVSLYHILTGQLPYIGENPQDLQQKIFAGEYLEPRRLRPDIPLDVAELIGQFMARDPAQRPVNGTAAWHQLSTVLGELRDVQSILTEALGHDPGVQWMRCGEKYRLNVRLPDGRQQNVFMESSKHRSDQQLLLIYSVCCPAQSSYYETALRQNAEFSHGGLGIREIDGVPHFVMVDTYPRGTVDPEEVRKSVREIAGHADQVELLLTGQDHH